MLESEQLRNEIGPPKVVDAIYDLMVSGSECDEDKLATILESICDAYNLFADTDRTSEIEKWSESVEIAVINWVLDALDGDMICLGFVADNIYSENKSAICTLFGVLSQDRYKISDFVINDNNEKLYKLKILREVMRFYEKIFRSLLKQPEVIDLMYKFEIHILLFMWICQNFDMVSYFIDLDKYFTFINNDILFVLNDLCSSKDNIPDLTIFFKESKSMLEKMYVGQIKENENFEIKINNFQIPKLASLTKAKDLFEPLMEYNIDTIIEESKLK